MGLIRMVLFRSIEQGKRSPFCMRYFPGMLTPYSRSVRFPETKYRAPGTYVKIPETRSLALVEVDHLCECHRHPHGKLTGNFEALLLEGV